MSALSVKLSALLAETAGTLHHSIRAAEMADDAAKRREEELTTEISKLQQVNADLRDRIAKLEGEVESLRGIEDP